MPSVHVVIVNYNCATLALHCAQSVLESSEHCCELLVTIVENGSTDDSREALRARLGPQRRGSKIRWIDAEKNGGFGAGCNAAISDALKSGRRPDFWWLVNPDARALPGCLERLLKAMETDAVAGAAGGGLVGWSGNPMTACGRDPSASNEFAVASQMASLSARHSTEIPSERCAPDWVCGANMLLRSRAVEQAKGFDEGFFLYFEDLDLCRRLRAAGWTIVHEPAAQVVHAIGKSTQIPVLDRWPRHFFESRNRYFLKHTGRWGLIKADVAWTCGWLVRRVRRWWDLGRTIPKFPRRFASDLLVTDIRSLLRPIPQGFSGGPLGDSAELSPRTRERGDLTRAMST